MDTPPTLIETGRPCGEIELHTASAGTIRIEILSVPVPKGRPRVAPSGHVYTPAKTRHWERSARWLAAIAMRGRMPMRGPIRARVTAVMRVPTSWPAKRRQEALAGVERPTTKPDADNIAKAALDACSGIVFRGDQQVVEVTAVKIYGPDPKVVIEIGGAP